MRTNYMMTVDDVMEELGVKRRDVYKRQVEMEIRELLNEYEFPGDDTPVIQGSALKALEDPNGEWGDKKMCIRDSSGTQMWCAKQNCVIIQE